MSLPLIFSIIFFAAFVLYFFFGLYVLFLNVNSTLHRVFFFSFISLCFWAFSFSIANSAPDYETCLFWRRMAAVGWGIYYSILLHCVLILTDKNRLLQKKWLYVILYLPAAFNLFVFCLYRDIAEKQYHLFQTYNGWVNVSENSGLNIWFNIYYIIFSVIGVGLLLHWGATAKDKLVRRQSAMMGTSFVVAILAGTLTEIVINALFPITTLQIAPIIILLPMSVMLYCIKRYRFLAPIQNRQTAEAGQIMSESARARLYWFLMMAYLFGAFFSFAVQYFSNREALKPALMFSAVMLIFGIALQAVQVIKIRLVKRDILSDILMSVTIPVMILRFIDYSTVYALTVPVIFVLVSVAFNQRRMLNLIGFVTLITLLSIWIIKPSQKIAFEHADHFSRIIIFLLILWIAILINQMYCRRLIQYEEQMNQQEMIAGISSDFVSADENNIDDKINGLLKRCGEYFSADHVYIIFFDHINQEVNLFFEWRNAGIQSITELIADANEEDLPMWLNQEQLVRQGMIYITRVGELKEERPEKKWLEDQGIRSVVTMLLMEKEQVIGYLGFHAVDDKKILGYGTAGIIKMIGNQTTHILLKVAAEKELNHMAYYDNLTDVPNRTLFYRRLEKAIAMAAASDKLVGIIYLDLDLFKTVNDIMGHDYGDSFLKQVAQNLSACLQNGEMLARFGGDEFLIFIPQSSHMGEIIEVAKRITDLFRQPVLARDQEFSITASMGISVYPIDGDNPEELVKSADLAMYASKTQGKNIYTVCSDYLKKDFLLKSELTNSLYHALERDEFELYYQPKVKPDGALSGMEALIRWNHPKRGQILPDEFIPIAESIGLISSIDQWVLRKACCQSKVWQDMGLEKITIAVNLSPAQFYRDDFLDLIKEALTGTGLEPKYLEVEITESIAYYRPEAFIKILDSLKEIGLTIAIDDFGSDYSSLSRLQLLPVDRLKIDKQFIDEIPYNLKQRDIVKAILALGSTLGMKVTVEGVENKQQMEFFQQNSCDEIQGYYFYQPMPADEMESVLRR